MLGYIEKGLAEGAKLILDGRDIQVEGYPKGFFVGPTVFDEVTPDMTIAREEIFGPVVPITRVKDLEEAIEMVNNRGFSEATNKDKARFGKDGHDVYRDKNDAKCKEQS